MKILAVLPVLVGVIIAVNALPVENASDLSIELNVRKSLATKKNTADVILINTGNSPIVVFSKGLTQMVSRSSPDMNAASLDLQIPAVEWNGHRLVESHCAFAPVTLQPGEATKYNLFEGPFGDPFAPPVGGKAESLTVNYTISPEDGVRYGVWSGTAASKVFKVVDGEIQDAAVKE